MIIKKNEELVAPKKEVNSLLGVLLLIVSIVLFLLTSPIGFVFGVFYVIFNTSKKIGEYCLNIAISIDQLGNVVMQHLLNVIWIRPEGYLFGNRKETISSVLGKNEKSGTLNSFGKLIAQILNNLDKNHTLNSIDYEVK